MSSTSKAHKGNYRAIKSSENDIVPNRYSSKDGIHLNNLWSIWYGIICAILQGYLAYRCLKEILGYSVLEWPDGLPYFELNCSLGLNGAVFLLLPIFFTVTILKVGNLANDGYKLGRQTSMCSREPSDILGTGGSCGLFRYGGPTAPFIHIAIAFCLLIPKLLMEAKLIQAGVLPQDHVWHTDLDFLIVHKNRSVVLSFVPQPNNASASAVIPLNFVAQRFYKPGLLSFSGANVTHTVMKTLKDIVGHDTRNWDARSAGGIWSSSISLEYINLIMALIIYSVRYPAIFWSANKSLGLLFSFLLFINGFHIVLTFAGISILYKIHVANVWSYLPFLHHHSSTIHNNFDKGTPFLLNAEVTFGLYMLSTLLILASSVVMYFYGHTRFTAFINHQRDRKLITLQGSTSNAWLYFTHCAAFCVLISIGICNAPLVHDYAIVYKGSYDTISLICVIYVIFHLMFWIFIWLFLSIKNKWTFKIRISIGEAVIKESRSLRLIHSVHLNNHHGEENQQPLLIIGNGRTYTVSETSPKKAIMEVLQKSAAIKKSKSNGSMAASEELEEEVYWLRPALDSASNSKNGGNKYFPWFRKRGKQKVMFSEISSTSANRTKSSIRNSAIPGIDEDDGDYATLRELPLASTKRNSIGDNSSEEGKLLACVHDEEITYASTSQDFTPPVTSYHGASSIMEPIVIHTDFNHQPSTSSNSERLIRADSGILAHEEIPGRSNSISTECSVSPPDPPGSSHSESSSGVHSNESTETSVLKQTTITRAPDWKSSQLDNSQTNNLINLEGTTESKPESTVVIRRRSLRPNPNEGVAEHILKEDPYGRATNMRMTSFMDGKGGMGPSSSATLPHYPTQPSVQNVFSNCSTMPMPQHTSQNIPQNLANGNSCNVYPNRPHTTIPTHLNGVKLIANNQVAPLPKKTTIPGDIVHSIAKLEPIYTKINRNTNEICHYSTRHS
ncbi:protein tincar [Anthonomus grandis grandis]|uniref:protein tincar n=1 Tax=Anthonomus grandis grandis TaxID=2921223 RepID=UPI0021669429|nr:protein tincar [Anthonomus grandis grandis]